MRWFVHDQPSLYFFNSEEQVRHCLFDTFQVKQHLGPVVDRMVLFLQRLILEMNRLGMLVDLAHVSVQVMNQVLDISKAPVIFSHSSAYSVCQHKRNVPDEVLLRVVSVFFNHKI